MAKQGLLFLFMYAQVACLCMSTCIWVVIGQCLLGVWMCKCLWVAGPLNFCLCFTLWHFILASLLSFIPFCFFFLHLSSYSSILSLILFLFPPTHTPIPPSSLPHRPLTHVYCVLMSIYTQTNTHTHTSIPIPSPLLPSYFSNSPITLPRILMACLKSFRSADSLSAW